VEYKITHQIKTNDVFKAQSEVTLRQGWRSNVRIPKSMDLLLAER
jgi:hypothetical protein